MKKVCEHCGARMMEHRHVLSTPLVRALRKIAAFTNAVNLQALNLSRNEWDNFQKLRYWGLVEKARRPDGTRMRGYWYLTNKGRRFLAGQEVVPGVVWTYRGDFVRHEAGHVSVFDLLPEDYRTQEDYAREAEPHAGA